MRRITVSLTEGECVALLTLAERERRDPRAQAAVIIRGELERRGFLKHELAEPDLARTADASVVSEGGNSMNPKEVSAVQRQTGPPAAPSRQP